MSDIAVRVENLSKKYIIGNTSSGSLRDTIAGLFSKSGHSNTDEFWALKDISFDIKRGEAVGIIGKNGAGKSTLLKVLSRITEPTTGRIEIDGRVSSLLEVGTGFHPELTGRENIFLNGTILGMSRAEVKAKFDEIVDFSGIERFLDTPVKRYSSGMKVRLAFAVAAHLEPEILIIDEVLAVGDAEFQKKCLGKMEDVAGQGRTVLFVSHHMKAIKNLCSRSIWLKDGLLFKQGDVDKISEEYLRETTTVEDLKDIGAVIESLPTDPVVKLNDIRISQNGTLGNTILNGQPTSIKIDYTVFERTQGLRVYFDLIDEDEDILIRSFHDEDAEAIPVTEKGSYTAEAVIPANLLAPRTYSLIIRISIFNVRTCTGEGIKINLIVESSNSISNGYPLDSIRSKLQPKINWENKRKHTAHA